MTSCMQTKVQTLEHSPAKKYLRTQNFRSSQQRSIFAQQEIDQQIAMHM
jgi:hypothetical protein